MLLIQLLFKRFLFFILFVFCSANENLGENMDLEFNINGVKFTMIFIKGGSFIMGNDNKKENQQFTHKIDLKIGFKYKIV